MSDKNFYISTDTITKLSLTDKLIVFKGALQLALGYLTAASSDAAALASLALLNKDAEYPNPKIRSLCISAALRMAKDCLVITLDDTKWELEEKEDTTENTESAV